MNWYTLAWIGWGILFLIVEGLALRNHTPGDTFTEVLRNWAGKGWTWKRWALLFGLVWLTGHLVFGW